MARIVNIWNSLSA